MNLRTFLTELRRRNLYKVAIAYGVVAWLLMQVASQIFPFFEIPNWAVRFVVLLPIIGFPVALILAWAFELTPEGLKRTEFADQLREKSAPGRTWIYVVIVASAISVSLFFLGRYTAPTKLSGSANAAAKIDRGAAVRQHERGQGERVFLRRDLGRTAEPVGED